MAPVPILTVSDLAKSYGAEEIFAGVSFQVVEREHVALDESMAPAIDRAGIIAGIEHPNAGTVAPLRGLSHHLLPQEGRSVDQ